MKQMVLVSLILFLSACSSSSLSKLRQIKPIAFEIEKGGEKSILFGSMHECIDLSQLPSTLLEKVKASNLLMVELSDKDFKRFANRSGNSGFIESKKPLDQRISKKAMSNLEYFLKVCKSEKDKACDFYTLEKLWKYNDHYIKSVIFESQAFMGIVGSYIASDLEKNPKLEQEFKDIAGRINVAKKKLSECRSFQLDRQMEEYAKKNMIPTASIESAYEIPVETMLNLGEYSLEELLTANLGINYFRETEKSLDSELESIQKYVDGDEVFIKNRFNQLTPSFRSEIIDIRNQKWISAINRYHESYSNVFFVVGAAHLVGTENNLPVILKRDGFKVTPLNF